MQLKATQCNSFQLYCGSHYLSGQTHVPWCLCCQGPPQCALLLSVSPDYFLLLSFWEARFHDCINKRSNNLKVAQCNGNGDIKPDPFPLKYNIGFFNSIARLCWVNVLLLVDVFTYKIQLMNLFDFLGGQKVTSSFAGWNQVSWDDNNISHKLFSLLSFLASDPACWLEAGKREARLQQAGFVHVSSCTAHSLKNINFALDQLLNLATIGKISIYQKINMRTKLYCLRVTLILLSLLEV